MLPILLFDRKASISTGENRTLTSRPKLIMDNKLNENLFNDFDKYFNDHFGFRMPLITLNRMIKYELLRSSVCPDAAIRGKEGWWFYIAKSGNDNLRDYLKKNLLNENELNLFKKRINDITSWCDEKNIKYLFVICPNKHSVYSEYYPIKRPNGITKADQIVSVFNELKVPLIFPRDYFISKKKDYPFPLYFETDTHWNSMGAFLSYKLIREKITKEFPRFDFPNIDYSTEVGSSLTYGDILRIIGIKRGKSTQVNVIPTESGSLCYSYKYREERDKVLCTENINKELPRAMIFRDSFFIRLEPFVSPMFSEAEYKWKLFRDEDKEYILRYKPDIIIFEVVEGGAQHL